MDWLNLAIVFLLATLVLVELAAFSVALLEFLTDRPEPPAPPSRPHLYHPWEPPDDDDNHRAA